LGQIEILLDDPAGHSPALGLDFRLVKGVDIQGSDQSEKPDAEQITDIWAQVLGEKAPFRVDPEFEVEKEIEEGKKIIGGAVKTNALQDEDGDEDQAGNAQDIAKVEKFVRSFEGL